ncbi:MAG: polysaccharide pyruvyl transferase family protein [Oscillospiraceae bacterium]
MDKKISEVISGSPLLKKIYSELFKIKIAKRNFKAKPQRIEQTKLALSELERVKNSENRIFFCGIPMHKNMGDQAQRYCIQEWCRSNYPDYDIAAIPSWPFYEKKFRNALKDTVCNGDIFVIQSGYCTTDRHYDHSMHRFLVKNFPDNRILIMPQTVNFFNEREGYKTGKIYDKHEHLLFLARDKVSFESAKQFFKNTPIYLYPDIVTTLIGSMSNNSERDGVLLCIRNDGEKKYSNEEIHRLENKLEESGFACEISDTNSDLSLEELVENFKDELDKTLRYFASHKVVITDRYHGTIFSMISNTPVIVLATNDHKVKTGTEWFKGVYDGAFYNANSLDEAYDIAYSLMGSNVKLENKPFFKTEYYDKLNQLVKAKS